MVMVFPSVLQLPGIASPWLASIWPTCTIVASKAPQIAPNCC